MKLEEGNSEWERSVKEKNINERRPGPYYGVRKKTDERHPQKSDPTASMTYNTC